MNGESIINHTALREKIARLKLERDKYETSIRQDLQQLQATVRNPVPFIKRSVHELASSNDFRTDLIGAGLNLALSYFSKKKKTESSEKRSVLSSLLQALGFNK